MNIELRDGIYCYADRELSRLIRPLFKVTRETWSQGEFSKEKEYYEKYFIDLRNGKFLQGLLPRVEKFCKSKKIPLSFDGDFIIEKYNPNPVVPGVKLRPEQRKVILDACEKQRGMINFATGTGKTIIASGIISCYPGARTLYFVHTKDLLHQCSQKFIADGYDVGICGDKKKEMGHMVTVATIQTFKHFNIEDIFDAFDIIIVDECHHLNSLKCMYFKILTSLFAPVKLGLSAKTPKNREGRLVLEGVLGPILGTLSISDGVEKGYLSKPKIKLLTVVKKQEIEDLRGYKTIYRAAIMENYGRNLKIVKAAKRRVKKKKSVLIFVKEIEHGKILYKLAKRKGLSAEFLIGKAKSDTRLYVKRQFAKKKVLCVITTLWKEGVDIPSLDCCINACGTRSEIMILQFLGRVLRTTKDKKKAEMIDFIDPYRYLAEHTAARIAVYVKEGLL